MNTKEYQAFVETAWGTMRPMSFIMTKLDGTEEEMVITLDELRSLFVMSTGMAGETGETLEHIKKFVRDGHIDLNKLQKELGDALYYLTRIALKFGLTLEGIMDCNHVKVTDRRSRGMIKGSGDDR